MTSSNTIPAPRDMELYKPYFHIQTGDQQLEVHIKFPSSCYQIASDSATPPPSGSCANGGELEHSIEYEQDPNCSDTNETVITLSLNYEESPNGKLIIIYTLDGNQSKKVRGITHSTEKVD
jgi:hypothetical protein